MYSLQLVAVVCTVLAGHVTALPNGGQLEHAPKGNTWPGITSPPAYQPTAPDGNPFSLTNDYESVVLGVETWTLFLQDLCGCTDSAIICQNGDLCKSGSQGDICGGQWTLANGGLAVGASITYISGDKSCSAGCNLAGGRPEDALSCNPFSD